MNILLTHRYYWPDSPPYASMLKSIAEQLKADGHTVTVFTAQPSYGGSASHSRQPRRETVGGVHHLRARLLNEQTHQMVRRVVNLVLFAGQFFGHVIRVRRYDVVMAATTPPVVVALAGFSASRLTGAKFVYHMQDVYPELLEADSRLSSLMHRCLRRVDSFTTARADRVVVLSDDMLKTVTSRPGSAPQVRVVNNFLPDRSHQPPSSQLDEPTQLKPGSLQVIFAGNVGRFQALHHAIEAFAQLAKNNIAAHLVIVGDGTEVARLQEAAGSLLGQSVFFVGRRTQAETERFIAASDVGLVTLRPQLIRVAFPSKTMTYLGVGIPVLATVEDDSELARLLKLHGAGVACSLSSDGIADHVTAIANDNTFNHAGVERLADELASRPRRLADWSTLFAELENS